MPRLLTRTLQYVPEGSLNWLVQDKGAYFAVSLNNRPQLAVVYHATAVAGFVAANKLL